MEDLLGEKAGENAFENRLEESGEANVVGVLMERYLRKRHARRIVRYALPALALLMPWNNVTFNAFPLLALFAFIVTMDAGLGFNRYLRTSGQGLDLAVCPIPSAEFARALGIPVNQGIRLLAVSWFLFATGCVAIGNFSKTLLAFEPAMSSFFVYSSIWAAYWISIKHASRYGPYGFLPLLYLIFKGMLLFGPIASIGLPFLWIILVAEGASAWNAVRTAYPEMIGGRNG